MTSYADYFVVASGESDRQVTAMAEHVQVKLKEQEGLRTIGTEGTETGQWVLLDFGEVVAHLFFTETRSFYDLEGLWADAPREKVA
jgi:ribosome-associated protein